LRDAIGRLPDQARQDPRYIENLVVLRYPDTEYDQMIMMGSRRWHYNNSSMDEIAEFWK
jgi:hypothetical protein